MLTHVKFRQFQTFHYSHQGKYKLYITMKDMRQVYECIINCDV